MSYFSFTSADQFLVHIPFHQIEILEEGEKKCANLPYSHPVSVGPLYFWDRHLGQALRYSSLVWLLQVLEISKSLQPQVPGTFASSWTGDPRPQMLPA